MSEGDAGRDPRPADPAAEARPMRLGCGCAPEFRLIALAVAICFVWMVGLCVWHGDPFDFGLEPAPPFTVEHRGWVYSQRPSADWEADYSYDTEVFYRGAPLPPQLLNATKTVLLTPIGVLTTERGIWHQWWHVSEELCLDGGLVEPGEAARTGFGPSDLAIGYYDTSARQPDAGPWLDLQLAGTPERWVYVFRMRVDPRPPAPSAAEVLSGRLMSFWDENPWYRRPAIFAFPRPEGLASLPGPWGRRAEFGRQDDYVAEPPGPWRPLVFDEWSYVYFKKSIARGVAPQGNLEPLIGRDAIEVMRGRYQGFWCDPERLGALPWRDEFR
ncbi:MAG: hypothetical protein AAF628_10510 [Planctomycetota bacterium]